MLNQACGICLFSFKKEASIPCVPVTKALYLAENIRNEYQTNCTIFQIIVKLNRLTFIGHSRRSYCSCNIKGERLPIRLLSKLTVFHKNVI